MWCGGVVVWCYNNFKVQVRDIVRTVDRVVVRVAGRVDDMTKG